MELPDVVATHCPVRPGATVPRAPLDSEGGSFADDPGPRAPPTSRMTRAVAGSAATRPEQSLDDARDARDARAAGRRFRLDIGL